MAGPPDEGASAVAVAVPLLGEVLEVLLHAAVQRVEAFDVQRVQHLSLEDPGQHAVAGQTLRAYRPGNRRNQRVTGGSAGV